MAPLGSVLAGLLALVVCASAHPGIFMRPRSGDVRSPCPALNTLANNGYLNRNGQGITADDLVTSLKTHFNLDPAIGESLANAAISGVGTNVSGVMVLSLDALDKHGFIEHDASLTRTDIHLGDSVHLNLTLFNLLVADSSDGVQLTLKDLAKTRARRANDCFTQDPECTFGSREKTLAFTEAAFLLDVLGHSGSVPLPFLHSWFVDENFPVGWVKSATEVGSIKIGITVAELEAAAPNLTLAL